MKKQVLEQTLLENQQYQVKILVDADTFSQTVEQVYQESRSEIHVPGFEKGKADRKEIEAVYGETFFYGQAAQRCCEETLDAFIQEKGLNVVGYPEITQCGTSVEGLIYIAVCDLYPTVRLGQYRGLSVEQPEALVTDKEVDEALQSMAEHAATEVPLERPAENGDFVRIDLEGTMDGQPFPGGKAEDYALQVGSHTFLPALEDGLCGMKTGEEKDIPVCFPPDYTPELAGKHASFHVTVRAVYRREVPPVDDAFAQTVFEMDSLKQLRQDVAFHLQEDRTEQNRQLLEDRLIAQAVANMECRIPDSMVQREADKLAQSLEERLSGQGSSLAQYQQSMGVDEAQFMESARKTALLQLQKDILFDAIRREEQLELDEAFLQEARERLSRRYGIDVDTLVQSLRPELLEKECFQLKIMDILSGIDKQ